MKFADPRSDIAFKKIFGSNKHKDILISFINAVLGLEGEFAIESLEILNPYQAPHFEELKETTLDVRAKDKRNFEFIVEMQVEEQEYFGKRALYYSSKSYSSQLKVKGQYQSLNPVYFIGILNFSLFSNEHYISHHYLTNAETYQQELTDFDFRFIELPKFTKDISELNGILEKWIYFVKNAHSLNVIPVELSSEPLIQEAFDIADRHKWTKQEEDVYFYWEMHEAARLDAFHTKLKKALLKAEKEAEEKGMEKGVEIGMEKGEEKARFETAINLRNLGVDEATIKQATGLSFVEIDLWINSPE